MLPGKMHNTERTADSTVTGPRTSPPRCRRARRAKRAILVSLLAAIAGGTVLTADAINAAEPLSKGDQRSPIRLVGGTVQFNPFVETVPIKTSYPVKQTADQQLSEIRLKTIGSAVGLLPIDAPAHTSVPLMVEPIPAAAVQLNPYGVEVSPKMDEAANVAPDQFELPEYAASPLPAKVPPPVREEPVQFSLSDADAMADVDLPPLPQPKPIGSKVVAPKVIARPAESPTLSGPELSSPERVSPAAPAPELRVVDDVLSRRSSGLPTPTRYVGRHLATVAIDTPPMIAVQMDETQVAPAKSPVIAATPISHETRSEGEAKPAELSAEFCFTTATADVLAITAPGIIVEVNVADPSRCRVVSSASRHLRLLGCGEGTTMCRVRYVDPVSGNTEARQDYRITIRGAANHRPDASKLQENLLRLIDQTYPTARIDLQTSSDRVVVLGSCDTAADATAILRLVRKTYLVPVEDRLIIR